METLLENAKKTGKFEVMVLDYLAGDDTLEEGDVIPMITIGIREGGV